MVTHIYMSPKEFHEGCFMQSSDTMSAASMLAADTVHALHARYMREASLLWIRPSNTPWHMREASLLKQLTLALAGASMALFCLFKSPPHCCKTGASSFEVGRQRNLL